jgi:hypothetical protein
MRVRTTYGVTPGDALTDADLPIEVTVEDVTLYLDRDEHDALRLVVERPVDRSALELVANSGVFWRHEDGTEVPIPALKVPESGLDAVAARDVLSALSFLSGARLAFSGRESEVNDDMVPDDPDDEALLERLGTRQRYRQTFGTVATRTVKPNVDTTAVGALLNRASGVRIYAMALAHGTASARFREMWRVLEAAFRLKDSELIDRLAEYGPASEMEFDRDELRDLHTLRGRASHAESRSGVHELEHVERECGTRLARLSCLAERVILTKRSWGYPTTAVEELSPLLAYVRRDGGIVYTRRRPSPGS